VSEAGLMYQPLSCFMTNFYYVYILVDNTTNTHF